jgi:hypothetical protein
MRRLLRPAYLVAGLLCAASGCRTADDHPPEYDRLNATEGGQVVVMALKNQGYPRWARSGALLYKIRTRTGPASDSTVTVENHTCDLSKHRIRATGSEGALQIRRIYAGGEYREFGDRDEVQDPAVLVRGRRRLIQDYFFSTLPFYAGRLPSEMERLEDETLGRISYHVVDVRFKRKAHLPPDPWYRLYFRSTTKRLEKVFFQAQGGDLRGQYIWCEYDNYADIEGALLPLHRRYYKAADEKGTPTGVPFLEQWLFEVSLESQADESLFSSN